MWLSRLRVGLVLILLAGLSACGYAPAYAPAGPAEALRVQIAIEAPVNRNEFDLVKQLELRLGRASEPKYRLSYDIDTVSEGVGLTPDQEIIRYNIYGKVRYTLRDIETDAVLTSGSTDTFTGYSVGSVDVTATPPSTNATIATRAAELDAYSRLMTALADQIVTRLIATSASWAQ